MGFLRRQADWRTLIFTATYFVLWAVMWFGYDMLPWLPFLVLLYITSAFSFIGAVAVHNIIHCPMFCERKYNKAFQVVMSLVYGHPVSAYVPGHNLSHHNHTQKPQDVMRTTKLRFEWHLLNGLFFFARIGYDMLSNDSAYFKAQKRLNTPIYHQFNLERTVVYTIAAVLIVLDFKKWVVVTLIPHIYAKACIISLNMLQHDGCDETSEFNHARDFTGRIINFFCYNNGYHSVHHMNPGMHWSVLKQQHEKLVKPYQHPNLDQPSLPAYMWRTFVYPGVRVDYLGNKLTLPPAMEDQPWFYDTSETYSTDEAFA